MPADSKKTDIGPSLNKVPTISHKDTMSNIVRGKLKIKGGPPATQSKIKKKRKMKKELKKEEDKQTDEQPVIVEKKKTEAELRFEEAQRERLKQRAKIYAKKSYREQIEEYNQKVARLSEHHDIPKVGPG